MYICVYIYIYIYIPRIQLAYSTEGVRRQGRRPAGRAAGQPAGQRLIISIVIIIIIISSSSSSSILIIAIAVIAVIAIVVIVIVIPAPYRYSRPTRSSRTLAMYRRQRINRSIWELWIIYIPQRGVQWKQGVAIYTMVYTSII